jgi:hypothetical protein
VAAALILGLAGCGGDGASGASSPETAVERFLAPFSEERPPTEGSTASEEVKKFWAGACKQVDPRVRRGMRFDEDDPMDPLVNCGAGVVLLVSYTGDTGAMLPPSKISGTPVSAHTSADKSIVTVDMQYATDERYGNTAPAKATIKVLVVKRDGSWWVATPQAFNPLQAAEGGFEESALRDQHEELLAAS